MTKEALTLALEALETSARNWPSDSIIEAITAIKEALAQPEQEPMALETVYETIIQWDEGGGKRSRRELARRIVSLYTTPPQRTEQEQQIETLKRCLFQMQEAAKDLVEQAKSLPPPQRKPLTDEEIGAILEGVNAYGTRLYTFARAIEAVHGIKE